MQGIIRFLRTDSRGWRIQVEENGRIISDDVIDLPAYYFPRMIEKDVREAGGLGVLTQIQDFAHKSQAIEIPARC